jgi:dipeptidyl aminopeptidase/acylaminoacyl peptidase
MFSVSNNGTLAYTHSTPDHPADLAIVSKGKTKRLTNLNKALFEQKTLGKVEEVWYKSSIRRQKYSRVGGISAEL